MTKTQAEPKIKPRRKHAASASSAPAMAPCDAREPQSFPRRVLLAVSGLSPQILTETLYALTQAQKPAWVPTEIHLLTTSEGAHRARLSLLSDNLRWFHRLCAEYQIPSIGFDASHIHVLGNAKGQPMEDIRSVEDNSAAADAITAKVREFSADPQCALHVSIAGGRKSMGFYVGYALSLYGRAQDRLSHVLVSEPFESTLDFFYPTRESHVLQTRDGRYADTKDAEVTLANIPFVSLRHGLPDALLAGNATFNETVNAARLALAPPRLEIDRARRTIVAGGKRVQLAPVPMAMLVLFARRAMQGLPPVSAPNKEFAETEWRDWFVPDFVYCSGGRNASTDSTLHALRNGMDGRWFSTALNRLHKNLKKALGPAATAYLVHDGACRPRRYGLQLAEHAIVFLD